MFFTVSGRIPARRFCLAIWDIIGKATGRPNIHDLNWYFAYNLFRLTGILQGIAGRIRDGTAASARAHESAARVVPLAKASWEYAVKAGAS